MNLDAPDAGDLAADTVTLHGDFAAAGQEDVNGTTFNVYASVSTEARVLTEAAEVTVNVVA